MLIFAYTYYTLFLEWKRQSIGSMDVRYNSIRRRIKSYTYRVHVYFVSERKRKKWSPVRRHQMQQQILAWSLLHSFAAMRRYYYCCFCLPYSNLFLRKYPILWNIGGTQQSISIFPHQIEQFQASILRHLLKIVVYLLSLALSVCRASCYSKACIYLLCQSIIMPIFHS